MEFLLVYPDRSAIGHAPFFGSSVAEAAGSAAAGFAEALGARLLTPEPDSLGALPDDARGALLPPGVVALPAEALEALVRGATRSPLRLENDRDQVIAVAGAAGALAPAVRPTFEESLRAMDPAPPVGATVPGRARIESAATWSAAIREAHRQTAERFLAAGVLVEDPDTLWADPSCRAAPGARIGAAVRLGGTTSVAAGAEVESFCRLENTEVGPDARVLGHSVLLDSSIGAGARVGPFAHIRPNTRLEPGAFAGSFVETKNAVLGRQAALPHLSYVGDAEIGPLVNLGAGTITCNYDGRAKYRTVVEAGAFVGSNAILVAPVTVGRRAFVAAGSVIVEDVPEEALAIARGRQVVKPGRAKGRFEGADKI